MEASGTHGESLREAVQNEILSNDLLKEDNILVDVEGDVVILYGDVDQKDKKWLAEDVALEVFGVLQVKNEIVVVPKFS